MQDGSGHGQLPQDLQRRSAGSQLEFTGPEPAGITQYLGEQRKADILLQHPGRRKDAGYAPERGALGDGDDGRPGCRLRSRTQSVDGQPGRCQNETAKEQKGDPPGHPFLCNFLMFLTFLV